MLCELGIVRLGEGGSGAVLNAGKGSLPTVIKRAHDASPPQATVRVLLSAFHNQSALCHGSVLTSFQHLLYL